MFGQGDGKSRLRQISSIERKEVYVEETDMGGHMKIQMIYVSSYVLRTLAIDLELNMQEVKDISHECGKACVGQTGHSIVLRLQEHGQHDTCSYQTYLYWQNMA